MKKLVFNEFLSTLQAVPKMSAQTKLSDRPQFMKHEQNKFNNLFVKRSYINYYNQIM